MTEEWRTFPVETPEQDKVLLLFDMLYEKLLVFTKQYWMGEAVWNGLGSMGWIGQSRFWRWVGEAVLDA